MIIEKEDMLAVPKRGKPCSVDPVSQEDLHNTSADDLILEGNEDSFVFCHACRGGIP